MFVYFDSEIEISQIYETNNDNMMNKTTRSANTIDANKVAMNETAYNNICADQFKDEIWDEIK